MPRPVHFEIHAGDPDRARAFYETVFGWKFERWGDNPYWLITTGEDGPGINGGLVPRRGPEPAPDTPVNAFVVTVDVPDLDATLQAAADAGAGVAVPKHTVPGVGWLAYIRDTENNILGMTQDDPAAR